MSGGNVEGANVQREPKHLCTLAVVAALSTCLYGVVALLSWQFQFDSPTVRRPIVPVLLLFSAAFAGYLFAVRVARRARQDGRLLGLIIWFAVVFRIAATSERETARSLHSNRHAR